MPALPRRRTFTVEEANATLPLVRAIVRDLVGASREVFERRERLSYLMGGRKRHHRPDPYHEELAQIEDQLEKDSRQLQVYLDELRQLGVEPKSATEGLVDFPAILEGRRVFLCWQLGEPEVLYWHDPEGGFAERQPLTTGGLASNSCGPPPSAS